MLTTICFDADDTLWHNERFFHLTQTRFAELLSDYADPDHLSERLLDAERRNLQRYGFGIKGFMLSMIETALQVTQNKVPGEVIADLIQTGQEMLRHPIELLPGAEDTVKTLAKDFTLLMITKGDLLDQERKLAQSRLGELFDGVEIVSDKSVEVYKGIFTGRGINPYTALMAGNSLKSDVNPVIEAGAWGVYVPHGLTWDLEAAEPPMAHERFREIATLDELPELVHRICRNI
ncbi:MAG: HAD family hydrolase [Silicimonas sp.]|nr:HAD family hydrolase [Silicimonas sp.]